MHIHLPNHLRHESDGARHMGSTVWLGLWVKRERDNRLRALRATRPHTVGYIGGCDQEQGEIECIHLPNHLRNLKGSNPAEQIRQSRPDNGSYKTVRESPMHPPPEPPAEPESLDILPRQNAVMST